MLERLSDIAKILDPAKGSCMPFDRFGIGYKVAYLRVEGYSILVRYNLKKENKHHIQVVSNFTYLGDGKPVDLANYIVGDCWVNLTRVNIPETTCNEEIAKLISSKLLTKQYKKDYIKGLTNYLESRALEELKASKLLQVRNLLGGSFSKCTDFVSTEDNNVTVQVSSNLYTVTLQIQDIEKLTQVIKIMES